MIKAFFIAALVMCWGGNFSIRADFMYLGRSDEGLMMGDAYTAVADDEMLLFYNPAALARRRGLALVPAKVSFQFPDVVEKEINFDEFDVSLDKRFEDWPKEPELVTERILGYPTPFSVQSAPHLRIGHFGANYFALSRMRMVLENAVNPAIDLDYRYDRGFILGYAVNIVGQAPSRNRRSRGHRSALGVAFKTIERRGLSNRIDLFGNEMLRITAEAENYRSLRRGLGYSRGRGHGFDLGWEHSYSTGYSTTTLGASWLDIEDIEFQLEEGSSAPLRQEQSVNLGLAHSRDLGLMDYTLAMDYHNLLESKDFSFNQMHFGARLRFPLVALYAGHNAGYVSVGMGLNLFYFDLKFGLYGLELGRKYREYKEKRMLFSVELAKVSLDQIGF